MRCYGITGWKNTGKTALVERLVHHFSQQGLRVSTLKHAHHDFDIDQPGRDSFRHRAAGAGEVLVVSENRWALMHENEKPAPPELDAMLAHLSPCDLVLVEGFKNAPHLKIEASLSSSRQPLIADGNKTIRALALNYPFSSHLPILDIDNTRQIADYILRELKL